MTLIHRHAVFTDLSMEGDLLSEEEEELSEQSEDLDLGTRGWFSIMVLYIVQSTVYTEQSRLCVPVQTVHRFTHTIETSSSRKILRKIIDAMR